MNLRMKLKRLPRKVEGDEMGDGRKGEGEMGGRGEGRWEEGGMGRWEEGAGDGKNIDREWEEVGYDTYTHGT